MVELIINKYHAIPNLRDGFNHTPLFYAQRKHQNKIVELVQNATIIFEKTMNSSNCNVEETKNELLSNNSSSSSSIIKLDNIAFVFIKPTAITTDFKHFVENYLLEKKIFIIQSGEISSEEIQQKFLFYFFLKNIIEK